MLNKECCIKCRNTRQLVRWGIGEMWIENNEEQWKEGTVICPLEYVEEEECVIKKITDEPPPKCPFYLEQII